MKPGWFDRLVFLATVFAYAMAAGLIFSQCVNLPDAPVARDTVVVWRDSAVVVP